MDGLTLSSSFNKNLFQYSCFFFNETVIPKAVFVQMCKTGVVGFAKISSK